MAEGGYRLPLLSFPPCFLAELLPQERDGIVRNPEFAERFWLFPTNVTFMASKASLQAIVYFHVKAKQVKLRLTTTSRV